jgi:hypothetical protein
MTKLIKPCATLVRNIPLYHHKRNTKEFIYRMKKDLRGILVHVRTHTVQTGTLLSVKNIGSTHDTFSLLKSSFSFSPFLSPFSLPLHF